MRHFPAHQNGGISMRTLRWSALLALAAATSLLASGTAAATVEWMTVSPAGAIRAPSSGTLSFTASGVTVRCNVTLSGSLSEGIIQTARDPFGEITSVESSACSGGELDRSGFGLPWTFGYRSVLGTRPLTGLTFDMLEATVTVRVLGIIRCVYRGNIEALLALSGSNPYRTGSLTLLGNEVPLKEGSPCGATGRVTGSLSPSTQELRARQAPGIGSTVSPAEAVPPTSTIIFPDTRVGFFNSRNLSITATQGAWRFGNCLTVTPEFRFDITGNWPCNRIIDATDPLRNVRVLTLRFIPSAPNTIYSAPLARMQPLPDITMTGRGIP